MFDGKSPCWICTCHAALLCCLGTAPEMTEMTVQARSNNVLVWFVSGKIRQVRHVKLTVGNWNGPNSRFNMVQACYSIWWNLPMF
jgi:hypothetical protein